VAEANFVHIFHWSAVYQRKQLYVNRKDVLIMLRFEWNQWPQFEIREDKVVVIDELTRMTGPHAGEHYEDVYDWENINLAIETCKPENFSNLETYNKFKEKLNRARAMLAKHLGKE
jgi:hypothetical protein